IRIFAMLSAVVSGTWERGGTGCTLLRHSYDIPYGERKISRPDEEYHRSGVVGQGARDHRGESTPETRPERGNRLQVREKTCSEAPRGDKRGDGQSDERADHASSERAVAQLEAPLSDLRELVEPAGPEHGAREMRIAACR